MSAGSVSLESAIRTCKIDTAYADKIFSDRFLNPNVMVCPVWNGMDSAGRRVCPDSFYTKRGGCNSAEDRLVVENAVFRPQYFEYITLNSGGVRGSIYGHYDQGEREEHLQNLNNVTGNFGLQFGSSVYPGCSAYPYNKAMAQMSEDNRKKQSMQMGYESYERKKYSGF